MRLLAQFVGVLLLVGFIGAYFWWIFAARRCSGWCTSPAGGGWPTVSASPSAKLSTRLLSRRGPTRSRPGS